MKSFLNVHIIMLERDFPLFSTLRGQQPFPSYADLFIYYLHKIGLFITLFQYNTSDEDM